MDNKSDVMDNIRILGKTEEFDVTYKGNSYYVMMHSDFDYDEVEFDVLPVSKHGKITEKLREKIIKFVKKNA